MSTDFKIICQKCDEGALIVKGQNCGVIDESLIEINMELDEDEIYNSEIYITCNNCGNSTRIYY